MCNGQCMSRRDERATNSRTMERKYPPRGDDRVDPRRFIGQPLILRHTWGRRNGPEDYLVRHDYVAMIAGYSAARFMCRRYSDNVWRWDWSLQGIYSPVHLRPADGTADSLEEAKRDVRRCFDRWLEWALSQPSLVSWYGADSLRDPPFDPPIDPETGTWRVEPTSGVFIVCNLWSLNKTREEVRLLVRALRDLTSNQPPQYGVYPDYEAGVVRLENGERIIANARWGLPTPPSKITGNRDPGVTNVRNTASSYWTRWLGPENRCLVPFTSFAEPETMTNGKSQNVWFALDESRPIACFAGVWVPQWKSVRKVKKGEETIDLFAFLTTKANKEVELIHTKAMPVILTKEEEWETWLTEEWDTAMHLQRPLPDNSLVIVARGGKSDGEPN